MLTRKVYLPIIILVFYSCQIIQCQQVDTSSFKVYPRLSFYTYEKKGEFLLHIPAKFTQTPFKVSITIGERIIGSWSGKPGKKILRIPVAIDLDPAVYRAAARISVPSDPGLTYVASTELIILSHKANEVKTDRFTGGMIVNKRQFFPFGFYCYSPVSPTLPEKRL